MGANSHNLMSTASLQTASLQRDLQMAVSDLRTVNRTVGLCRALTLGGALLATVTLAWGTGGGIAFWLWSVVAGLLYSFWLICTHDATHHSLTGWIWFEETFSRVVAWPMLWPHGVYAELHRLHHGWNGLNLRDPERIQWTQQEYQQAGPLLRWYVRHQWAIDILLLGGFGLILKTLINGLRLRKERPHLMLQLGFDLGGMALAQTILVAILLLFHGSLLRYILFWLVLERTIGAIVQTRDHLEHYGLWGDLGSYRLTQLYACRNLKVPSWVNWLMGGLPYHAVHHAFPDIPFNQLPEAYQRIQAILRRHNMPSMTMGQNYLRETLRLSRQPTLIEI